LHSNFTEIIKIFLTNLQGLVVKADCY